MKFLIIEARFYYELSDLLLEGAEQALRDAQMEWDVVQVPGALEIPAAIAIAYRTNPTLYQGYIALGAVIRGETSHYDVVAGESASGLQALIVRYALAIGNGILTCDNEQQAFKRADMKDGNKGARAAQAALSLAFFQRTMNNAG